MTITSDVTAIQIPGNGSGTIFAAPMKIFAATDLIVGFIVGGIYTQQTSGYSITNIDINGGCTVIFTTAPPIGTTVDLRTQTPETQGTEFANLGAYLPESTTDTVDRIVRMIQDLSRLTYDYGIHGPDTESTPWTALPIATSRANGALVFDANGSPTIGVPVAGTITGPLIASLLTQNLIGSVFYPQTATESSLAVVPTNYQYPADPYIDPRRYGADPTGGADSSAAMQLALNVALQCHGVIWIGPNCNFKCGGLSLTLTGVIGTCSLRIMGSSSADSLLTLTGTPAALISFIGPTFTGAPQPILLVIENLGLQAGAHLAVTDAILLHGVANVVMRNVMILGFSACVNLHSALDVYFDSCTFLLGRYGIYARTDGTGSPDNRILLTNCTLTSHSLYGIDYDGGSHLSMRDCDIETNGVVGNFSTGGIHIGANINNTVGMSIITLDGCWLEANNGWGILIDAPISGQSQIAITNGFTAADDATGGFGHAIKVSGAYTLLIDNFRSGTPTSKWDLTANQGFLRNGGATTVDGSNITWPTYFNIDGNGVHMYAGRIDSFTGTLTGCTTSPTATIGVVQQGSDCTFEIPSLTATSNSTGCSITGIPAKYQPATDQNFAGVALNNGAAAFTAFQILAGSGTLTFNSTFTGSGTKGSVAGPVRFKLIA